MLFILFNMLLNNIGHPPVLPEFASGFWQCKNRYRNQTELLDIAQGYLNRSLPLSVIVVDYYHWVHFGNLSSFSSFLLLIPLQANTLFFCSDSL